MAAVTTDPQEALRKFMERQRQEGKSVVPIAAPALPSASTAKTEVYGKAAAGARSSAPKIILHAGTSARAGSGERRPLARKDNGKHARGVRHRPHERAPGAGLVAPRNQECTAHVPFGHSQCLVVRAVHLGTIGRVLASGCWQEEGWQAHGHGHGTPEGSEPDGLQVSAPPPRFSSANGGPVLHAS